MDLRGITVSFGYNLFILIYAIFHMEFQRLQPKDIFEIFKESNVNNKFNLAIKHSIKSLLYLRRDHIDGIFFE